MWVGAPSVFWILDSGFWIPSSLGSVTHILGEPCGSGLHLYSGFWILDSGFLANPVCELSACASKSTRSDVSHTQLLVFTWRSSAHRCSPRMALARLAASASHQLRTRGGARRGSTSTCA